MTDESAVFEGIDYISLIVGHIEKIDLRVPSNDYNYTDQQHDIGQDQQLSYPCIHVKPYPAVHICYNSS